MAISTYRPRQLARSLRLVTRSWSNLIPTAVAIVGAVILVGAALLIARSDGTLEVAADASVQVWAGSVSSAANTVRSDLREALVVAQSADLGVVRPEDVQVSVDQLRDSISRLTGLLEEGPGSGVDPDHTVFASAASFTASATGISDLLQGGRVAEALRLSDDEFAPAYLTLVGESSGLGKQMSHRITVVLDGVGKVGTAARFVAAFLIPAIAVLLFFRKMRAVQVETLLRARLRREQDLHARKDAFLAAASHHIRTPLAAVVGFSELLRDRTRDFSSGVRTEVTELLAIQARETSDVVDDLLVAARQDLEELWTDETDVEVRDVLDKVVEDWESTQRTRLTVTGSAVLVADPRWLGHALRNLLRNAAAFGGDYIEVRITEGFRKVVVEVADNGPGIPEAEMKRMFDVYYSKAHIEGLAPSLGLGLAVARRIARSMGGDLEYLREDDQNVFRLVMPKPAAPTPAVSRPIRVIDPLAGRPELGTITEVIAQRGPPMVYQPVVETRTWAPGTSRVVGYEALARFPTLTPPDWFETAAAIGIKLDLELACISAAIEKFSPATPDAFLAVNLSDRTLQSSRLDDYIGAIDPGRLVLELSEGSSIKSYETTRHVVETLSGRGIRLALDDVGSGDIDLWHISRLGASIIKLDIALVRDLHHSPRNRALVRGIAAMAEDLGVMVIAEGIETEQEHLELTELGIRFGQGFLYGRPAPPSTP